MKKITLPFDIGDLVYYHSMPWQDFVWECKIKSATYTRATGVWHFVAETTKPYFGDYTPIAFDYCKGKFYNITVWAAPQSEGAVFRKTMLRIVGHFEEERRLKDENL